MLVDDSQEFAPVVLIDGRCVHPLVLGMGFI